MGWKAENVASCLYYYSHTGTTCLCMCLYIQTDRHTFMHRLWHPRIIGFVFSVAVIDRRLELCRHLLCLLKATRSSELHQTRRLPSSDIGGGCILSGTQRHKRLVVQLIEGLTVAAAKCALTVAVCAVTFIKTFLRGLGRRWV